jgi:hypothetical protein
MQCTYKRFHNKHKTKQMNYIKLKIWEDSCIIVNDIFSLQFTNICYLFSYEINGKRAHFYLLLGLAKYHLLKFMKPKRAAMRGISFRPKI